MPKDEADPQDPMELRGVGLATEVDTCESMTECFIEEFMRLGYDAEQLLALFRNPHFTGVHMVLQNRGEEFIRAKIREVFGWWRRGTPWGSSTSAGTPARPTVGPGDCPASRPGSAILKRNL